MKKGILILSAILAFNTNAESITGAACGDDCTWVLENGILTLTGSGKINEYVRGSSATESTAAPWYRYQEQITKVVIQNKSETEQFTSIGSYSFEDMYSTREVVLPEGLKIIGDQTFGNNPALETINLPSTLETLGRWALYNTSISEINLPDGITTVGGAAFLQTNLETVIFPDSVTSLTDRLFERCPNLTTVVFGEGMTSIDYSIRNESSFPNTPLLTNLYCPENNQAVCQQTLRDSGKTEEEIENIITKYTKEDGVYILEDGNLYTSASNMASDTKCTDGLDKCKAQVLKNNGLCSNIDQDCAQLVNTANNGKLIKIGSKTYSSLDALLKGNYDKRRIYTIDEANFVAGPVNRVSIKYR